MNIIQKLAKLKLITPPKWLPDNLIFLSKGGSHAYHTNNETSDMDIWGVVAEPRGIIFPQTAGYIHGFGTKPPSFEVYQQHHVYLDEQEFDINCYGIVKFFDLCFRGNPNLIDFLCVNEADVLHITKPGQHIRDNRELFLTKNIYWKFRGFIQSHIRSIKKEKSVGRRSGLVEKYSYDVKDASHLVRCCLALKEILETRTYCVSKNKEVVKAVRAGVWSFDELNNWYESMDKELSELFEKSTIPDKTDELEAKNLLLQCLEIHYGKLDNVIQDDSRAKQMLKEIHSIINNGIGAF